MTDVAARPALRLERRLADERDTDFVRSLFADSCGELLLLTPDTRDLIVDMQFRARRRGWRLDHPDATHEMLLLRGVRAGHLLIDQDASTVQLVDLAVRAGLRGLGLGRELLAELTADADRTRRTVRLQVPSTNHGARRFFEGCGFAVGGTLAGHHVLFRPPSE